MSRVGKQVIKVPKGVTVRHDASKNEVAVSGPKGDLTYSYHRSIEVKWDEASGELSCAISDQSKDLSNVKAFWGTTRSRIANMVVGVTEGYSKVLEIIGVGWNARVQGQVLQLNIGFCHPVDITPPKGVAFEVKDNKITISGADKQAVGQFAAEARSKRPPEPYNGKGILYDGEIIIRKQGKVFGA